MKKRLLFIFALVVLCNLVLADEVTLFDPDGATFTDTRNVTFECNVTAMNNISNVSLFFGPPGIGLSVPANVTFDFNGLVNDTNASFYVENIRNGSNYEWTCLATLINNSKIAGAKKYFGVNVSDSSPPAGPNTPPELIQNISDISWNKSTSTTIDLSEFFNDSDGDTLNYSADAVNHIDIDIQGSDATLTPDSGWSGNGTTKFYASDGTNETESNEVLLIVVDTDYDWDLGNETDNVTANEVPVIEDPSPIESPLTMESGTSQQFSISAQDPENEPISYKWYVDGQLQPGATSYSYTLQNAATGAHTVKVEVLDAYNGTSEYSWQLVVQAAAAPKPAAPKAAPKAEPKCGNDKREEGEDCSNCPEDVKCGPSFECVEGECVEVSSSMGLIIAAIGGLIALLVGAFFVFRFIRKKAEVKAEKKEFKPLTKMKKPEVQKPAETKPQPKVEQKPAEEKLPGTEEADPLLLDFIAKMRAKGKTDEEIKAKLKETGWTDEQIVLGFK